MYDNLKAEHGGYPAVLALLAVRPEPGPGLEAYFTAKRETTEALFEATDQYVGALLAYTDALRATAHHRLLLVLATKLAGRRRAHLQDAWMADLAGTPEAGFPVPPRRRFALAAGFVLAAARLRLHDTTGALWRPVDWVLASTSRTGNTITTATGTLAVYIHATGGLHQLLTTGAVTCTTTAGTLYVLTHWLRRVHGTEHTDRALPQSGTGPGDTE
ncbi:hypothetical protein ACFVZ3_43500 [Kitasatospora purpeofusca]|uniref:hypothetical protein n=1 Tax=Kitasatospora purpeofusca TaxID=67352 RepID=UPI0036AF1E66